MLSPLDLLDADVACDPQWLPVDQANALFATLRSAIRWDVHRVKLFGRQVDSPRRSCWIGDPGAVYAYSGTRFQPHPWPQALRPIRARLVRELDVEFNSALANLYRDGRDCMGWHRDNEAGLGRQPVIASLSLGAPRRFVLKDARDPGHKLALELPHGSLLVMRGDTQCHYKHALPRTAKPVAARINLTFRQVLA